jgi:hypothetical protein
LFLKDGKAFIKRTGGRKKTAKKATGRGAKKSAK